MQAGIARHPAKREVHCFVCQRAPGSCYTGSGLSAALDQGKLIFPQASKDAYESNPYYHTISPFPTTGGFDLDTLEDKSQKVMVLTTSKNFQTKHIITLTPSLTAARFVNVYHSHKLCMNVPSYKSCGNASGISPSYKGCGNDVCQFLNQLHECQNLAFILWMVPLNYATVLPLIEHNSSNYLTVFHFIT